MENKVLRHVVLFKFKDNANKEAITTCEQAFIELKEKISCIKSLEWGTNVSSENLSQGFTHCFLLAFDSDSDRDAYLVHEDHKEFGRLLGPILDKVLVVDFWV